MGKKAQAEKQRRRASGHSRFAIRVGAGTVFEAHAEVSAPGLLATGAVAGTVLLSTAMLVGVAIREARRPVDGGGEA